MPYKSYGHVHKFYINIQMYAQTVHFILKPDAGPSWSLSYGSWIYNYLCNQCLSPITLWVWIPLRRGVLNTTLCDKVCQWHAAGRWFSPVFSTNKTDRHNITEIVLIMVLSTITLALKPHAISTPSYFLLIMSYHLKFVSLFLLVKGSQKIISVTWIKTKKWI